MELKAEQIYSLIGKRTQSVHIFGVYPDLEQACLNALRFVGEHYPGYERPLIVEMIDDAFNFYKSAVKLNRNMRHEFIHGLCNRAKRFYEVRYCANDSSQVQVWHPMDKSITEFESNFKDIFVLHEQDPQVVSKVAAQKMFAARILPGHLFTEIFEEEKKYA